MLKNIVFALCGCFLSFGLYAQSSSIVSVLQEIEQNNTELQAMQPYMESKWLELKSENNLPDLSLGGYYLPFGEHSTGDYSEFQISQSFEFPSVYRVRNSLIDQKKVQLNLVYKAKRQEILLKAKKYCLEIIYQSKRKVTEQNRAKQAKMVFDQVQELFDKEQVGILELNKAKVVWMQEQFKLQQIESDIRNLSLLLVNLNGGKVLTFEQVDYFTSYELGSKDIVWQSRLSGDPLLQQYNQQEVIAQEQLKLSKNISLPNFTAGFNSQGVSGERFSGIYGGLSIPLWSNRNKIKSAQANLEFRESYSTSSTMQAYGSFEKQFNDYQILLSKFNDYQSTLVGLNSDQLLLQAYQLGEISFMEYYIELQFYSKAYDVMLEIENQLYQLHADLLKHQL
ncbi:MAG: cobalt-zinc-cadmium efflux system outer membrane protein [Cyclobacteriaceae bacterium]|jgi:outer membrane protein TolC